MESDSRRLMNRSYRRVKRTVNRPEGQELYTADPMAAELQMAQIDATLAVVAATREMVVELQLMRRQMGYASGRGIKVGQATEQEQLNYMQEQLRRYGERLDQVGKDIVEFLANPQPMPPRGPENPIWKWWKWWGHE